MLPNSPNQHSLARTDGRNSRGNPPTDLTNVSDTCCPTGWIGFTGSHDRSNDSSLSGALLSPWNPHSPAATAPTTSLHDSFDNFYAHLDGRASDEYGKSSAVTLPGPPAGHIPPASAPATGDGVQTRYCELSMLDSYLPPYVQTGTGASANSCPGPSHFPQPPIHEPGTVSSAPAPSDLFHSNSYFPPHPGTAISENPISSSTYSPSPLPQNQILVDAGIPFSCQWMDCTEYIALRHSRVLVKRLRTHFEESHPNALDMSQAQKSCRWRGCICTTGRYERCKDQPPQHSAHIQDVFTHIRRVHAKEAPSRSSIGD